MTELRTDWLTGRTVFLAEHRALRPNEFAAVDSVVVCSEAVPTVAGGPCPFCPGQEANTPPAVYTRMDDGGHWRVRVVPNKFPVVGVDDAAAPGAHEVIIESARHVARMSDLATDELADVLDSYRQRLAHWRASGRFEFGLVFKNLGAQAGASLAHVHSQLVALPLPPVPVVAEFDRARQSFGEHGDCPYCRLIDEERRTKERVVLERDGLIAFCPYASLQPGEVWLMPTVHEPWFEQPLCRTGLETASEKGTVPFSSKTRKIGTVPGSFEQRILSTTVQPFAADPLAEILHSLVVRIEAILPRPAYNLLVRTSPWQDAAADCGHWRIEILPRTNPFAGLELATQIYINPISPSRAAQQLRSS